eukprot:15468396-Alexandrium_andersonii.AAC.1
MCGVTRPGKMSHQERIAAPQRRVHCAPRAPLHPEHGVPPAVRHRLTAADNARAEERACSQ